MNKAALAKKRKTLKNHNPFREKANNAGKKFCECQRLRIMLTRSYEVLRITRLESDIKMEDR